MTSMTPCLPIRRYCLVCRLTMGDTKDLSWLTDDDEEFKKYIWAEL